MLLKTEKLIEEQQLLVRMLDKTGGNCNSSLNRVSISKGNKDQNKQNNNNNNNNTNININNNVKNNSNSQHQQKKFDFLFSQLIDQQHNKKDYLFLQKKKYFKNIKKQIQSLKKRVFQQYIKNLQQFNYQNKPSKLKKKKKTVRIFNQYQKDNIKRQGQPIQNQKFKRLQLNQLRQLKSTKSLYDCMLQKTQHDIISHNNDILKKYLKIFKNEQQLKNSLKYREYNDDYMVKKTSNLIHFKEEVGNEDDGGNCADGGKKGGEKVKGGEGMEEWWRKDMANINTKGNNDNNNKKNNNKGDKMDKKMEVQMMNAKFRVKANHKRIVGLGKLPKLENIQ